MSWEFDKVGAYRSSEKEKMQPLTSVGDLLKEPNPEYQWLVSGLLLKGGFSLLCGKPKSGKSSFSRCLGLSIARGQSFLGRDVIKGNVVMFTLEDHRHMLRESFQKLGANGDENLFIHCGSLRGNPIRCLENAIKQYDPVLVIIDTAFRFTSCFDVNSYTAVLEALTPLSDLARNTGVHLLAVHHAGKAERSDSLDSVLGSVAVHGSMDATILLRRTSQYRVIESQQRYGIDLQPTILNFDQVSGWIQLGGAVAELETERIGEEIIELLNHETKPITEAEIAASVGGKTETKRRSLRMLVETGRILREGCGGRGSPYLYRLE